MKRKFATLELHERFISMMIDEIRVKPYFDYKGGNIVVAEMIWTLMHLGKWLFAITNTSSATSLFADVDDVNSMNDTPTTSTRKEFTSDDYSTTTIVPILSSTSAVTPTPKQDDLGLALQKDAAAKPVKPLTGAKLVPGTSQRPRIKSISEEAIQIGEKIYRSMMVILNRKQFKSTEELILTEEVDRECLFHKVEDDDFEKYVPEVKLTEYTPIDYKVKVINMVKEHPKWSLKSLHKRGASCLKNMKYLARWKEDIKSGGTTIDKYSVINLWTYDRFMEATVIYK
ncbi:hypothetical protein FQA39_LY18219 [Lamprigera yunnana]|nr:hypothetical protein FQA39_LY18219 [Lamprigera yunnana]